MGKLKNRRLRRISMPFGRYGNNLDDYYSAAPSFLLDILLVVNIALSVLILLMTLFST